MHGLVSPVPDSLRFEEYLRASFAELVSRLRASFSDAVAVEDVVQEALLRAWQLDLSGEPVRALEPWLTATATNLARSRWRTMKAEGRALEKVALDRSGDCADLFEVPLGLTLSANLACAMRKLNFPLPDRPQNLDFSESDQ